MKKIVNIYSLFILSLFLMIIGSCSKKNIGPKISKELDSKAIIHKENLKNGDLIFVGAIDDGLSGAIKNATLMNSKFNFDHIGMIEHTKDSIFVLHAAPKGGSQREEINQFYKNQKTADNELIIYRLKKEYQSSISSAIETAKSMLGKPYNWTYILNENEYYCSDFIERAFRKDSIFKHIPMNFKNKSTGMIDQYWIDLYRNKNLEIPQDQPGTNPNQLSNSPKLELYGSLQLFYPN